jgi:hypothetical protein
MRWYAITNGMWLTVGVSLCATAEPTWVKYLGFFCLGVFASLVTPDRRAR